MKFNERFFFESGIPELAIGLIGLVLLWCLSGCVQEPGRQPPVECKCPKCEACK